MHVVNCKCRTSLLLNTSMLLISYLSHNCQEMPYLMLKHLGINNHGKQISAGREGDNAPQHISCTSCKDALP